MLQPFQVSPQVPTPVTKQQLQVAHQQATTPIQPRSGSGAKNTTTSTPGLDTVRSCPVPDPLVLTIAHALKDPKIGTPRTSPSISPRQSIWKDTPPLKPVNAPPSPTRPRSLSPIDVRTESPDQAIIRTRRHKLDQIPTSEPHPAPGIRSTRASSRRKRGASTASSVVDSSLRDRTRSQSILSHVSADDSASKKVKREPPSTPMDTTDAAMDDTPMPAPPRRAPSTRNKRKRSVTAASEISEIAPSTNVGLEPEEERPTSKDLVLAVRNFPRLSNTIMMDVTSHRHASTFSQPVRDRDAEGYSDMILRPTDLKTIKAAIQYGARAITAATELDPSSSMSSSTLSSRDATALLLPWSEELVPPKAIVNSAQLERELMRMFANAVMFNPGEDDVVRDAREMGDDAVVKLVNFREAEKGAEISVANISATAAGARRSEVGEDDESEAPTTGTMKRRKVG
jgi:hypothetical protein